MKLRIVAGFRTQSGNRVHLDFDKLYGKAFKVTDAEGDSSREGFSIVTPENGKAWTEWKEKPEFKEVVRKRLNDPEFLYDYKYDQIVRSIGKTAGFRTQSSAIDKLITDLNSYDLWSKSNEVIGITDPHYEKMYNEFDSFLKTLRTPSDRDHGIDAMREWGKGDLQKTIQHLRKIENV
jgi:hypothetical protein